MIVLLVSQLNKLVQRGVQDTDLNDWVKVEKKNISSNLILKYFCKLYILKGNVYLYKERRKNKNWMQFIVF